MSIYALSVAFSYCYYFSCSYYYCFMTIILHFINLNTFDTVTIFIIVVTLIKVIVNFPSTHSVKEGDCETYCDYCDYD